jgi:hypothetical protein
MQKHLRFITAPLLIIGLAGGLSSCTANYERIPYGTITGVSSDSVSINGTRYHSEDPARYSGAVGLEVQDALIVEGELIRADIVAPEGSTTLKTSTHTCLVRPGGNPMDVEDLISCH